MNWLMTYDLTIEQFFYALLFVVPCLLWASV